MIVIEDVDEMASACQALKCEGKRIAFVPTMGYLHEGHLSLMKEGKKRGDILVVSIFINPAQFNSSEDFDIYPENLKRDKKVLEECAVDILFFPNSSHIYPSGYQTTIEVKDLSKGLCGDSRPGHFSGVVTIVAKLFNIVSPDIALFGEKDFQQLAIIKQMVQDLNYQIEILGMPIVREEDGLAMSSRNAHLKPEERSKAISIYQSLKKGESVYNKGEKDVESIIACAKKSVDENINIDYMEIRDMKTLLPLERVEGKALFAVAATVGKTRLIDNMIVGRN